MCSELNDFYVGDLSREVGVDSGLCDMWVEALVIVAVLYTYVGITRWSSIPSLKSKGGVAKARGSLKALELYKEMRREGFEITAVTFNSIVDMAATELVDVAHLQEVVNYMQSAPVAPDAMTFSILITASCHLGQLDVAMLLFKEIQTCGWGLDETVVDTLLSACSKMGRGAQAEEILREMRPREAIASTAAGG